MPIVFLYTTCSFLVFCNSILEKISIFEVFSGNWKSLSLSLYIYIERFICRVKNTLAGNYRTNFPCFWAATLDAKRPTTWNWKYQPTSFHEKVSRITKYAQHFNMPCAHKDFSPNFIILLLLYWMVSKNTSYKVRGNHC